ncbi:MAG TPA: hypothetical protein VLV87_03345 [Gammaproteobacteria bacterium]|nr:hypothetical protein [Gammaproteobacteria bacterium]
MLKRACLCAAMLLLAACGGSDNSASLEGTWIGVYQLDGSGPPVPIAAAIEDGGPALFYDKDGFSFYLPKLSGTTLAGTTDAYASYSYTFPNGRVWQHFTTAGTVSPTQITGSFANSSESGTFTLKPESLYSGTPSIVPGTWDGFFVVNSFSAVNVVMDASGSFQGSSLADRCTFKGTLTPVKAGENLYSVDVSEFGCAAGEMHGLAYQTDLDAYGFFPGASGHYYYVAASDSTRAFVAEFKAP